jgi:twitching motility protein PilU
MDKNTLHALLRKMVETDASDLFLTVGAPPHIKVQGESWPLSVPPLQSGQAQALAYSIMSAQQIADFERQLEANLSYTAPDIGRFRVSVYRQRGETAMVARLIHATIPDFESLGLPPVVQDLALLRRGLLLVVGAAGSGKSTTLASMIDHRARNSQGHILTIEDPIEYLFTHDRCTVDQREVGIDTHSFADALRNAMRQAPDIIMIGEIRDLDVQRAQAQRRGRTRRSPASVRRRSWPCAAWARPRARCRARRSRRRPENRQWPRAPAVAARGMSFRPGGCRRPRSPVRMPSTRW